MGEAVGVVAEVHRDFFVAALPAAAYTVSAPSRRLVSWACFNVIDFRHVLAQLFLDAVDDEHDRTRTIAAHAIEANARDAVGDVEHFEPRAVHIERRPDVDGERLHDACFQIVHR